MGGKAVLRKAVERGHEVTVLMRSSTAAGIVHDKVRVVIGDARDGVAVGKALEGCEAVVQYLGVGGMGDGKPNDLVPEATKVILDEMNRQKIKRIVCASNIGVPGSGAFLFTKVGLCGADMGAAYLLPREALETLFASRAGVHVLRVEGRCDSTAAVWASPWSSGVFVEE